MRTTLTSFPILLVIVFACCAQAEAQFGLENLSHSKHPPKLSDDLAPLDIPFVDTPGTSGSRTGGGSSSRGTGTRAVGPGNKRDHAGEGRSAGGGPSGGSRGNSSGHSGRGSTGGSSGHGGSTAFSGTKPARGGGVIDDKRRQIEKVNLDLLEHLKRREQARWNYEHGGSSPDELARFRHHDERIRKLQQARFQHANEVLQARRSAARSKTERERIEAAWDRFIDSAKANYGLKSDKFKYADQNYNIPTDKRELTRWLATPE